MASETVQIITTALAVLGAVLGVINAWRSWVKDRPNIKVSVSAGIQQYRGELVLINIRNLSSFPITVTHLGFDVLGRATHGQIVKPEFTRGETLPVRLEPRTSVTALCVKHIALPPDYLFTLTNAYIQTDCGLRVEGGKRYFDDQRAAIATQLSKG
jgi:hypothetical protein